MVNCMCSSMIWKEEIDFSYLIDEFSCVTRKNKRMSTPYLIPIQLQGQSHGFTPEPLAKRHPRKFAVREA